MICSAKTAVKKVGRNLRKFLTKKERLVIYDYMRLDAAKL